jgi:flagellin
MNIGMLSNLLNENSTSNNKILGNSLEKLSTGLKINKASDNASGLAISDKLRTQASGIKQGIDNANSAIAMMNIADKSMTELSNILDTIKAKAIQMNTDTTSQDGRKAIKTDILKLIDSYDNIVCGTNYNKTPLLNGCASPFTFQVGDDSNEIISVNVDSVESRHMGEVDPYKLKNFITGFNTPSTIPTTTPIETNLNNILSSEIPEFENLTWSKNVDGTYESNGIVDLSSTTKKLLDINHNYIKDIEFTFNNFDYVTERFTIKDSNTNSIVGELKLNTTIEGNDISFTDKRTGYIEELTPLDSTYLNNWYYENNINGKDFYLISENLGSIRLENLKKDTSIEATGAYLTLNKIVITLQDNLPTSPISTPTEPESPSCDCNSLDLTRNDDSPTLLIQAQNLMKVIDESLNQLNSQRANVASGTNQLESSTRNQMSNYVNIKSAESIIRDVDYSSESASFNKANIIAQAGSYVQSQANEIDQKSVLLLLK